MCTCAIARHEWCKAKTLKQHRSFRAQSRNPPCFALALMHVINAVEEVVFIVPAKRAKQHAKIQPWIADSLHIFIQHGKQRMWLLVEVIQIPCANSCCSFAEACAIPARKLCNLGCTAQ